MTVGDRRRPMPGGVCRCPVCGSLRVLTPSSFDRAGRWCCESGDLDRFRPVYADRHGLGPDQHEALVATAKALTPSEFARRASTTTRTARLIAEGRLPRAATTKRILRALGDAEVNGDNGRRVCALDGCGRPVKRPDAQYCCPTHRHTAKIRRQRAARMSPTGPTGP